MTESSHKPDLTSTLLGKETEYVSQYDASLLCPIPRQHSRDALGLQGQALPFYGMDHWTAYEVSWLTPKGKPVVAVADFWFAADTRCIVESKSFKLYLNSLNQTRFADRETVLDTLTRDLQAAAEGEVRVQLHGLREAASQGVTEFTGVCIDDEDVACDIYSPAPELLRVEPEAAHVSESLYSDLLKSNCPVTGQPDWASLWIDYEGAKLDRGALLRYIVSFREHQDFHEHCVERIFSDILKQCEPRSLTVYARYTRRGGLDINPYRSTAKGEPARLRLVRQ